MTNIECIEQWFYQYKRDIYNFLIYYMGTKDVDDVFQECFLKAFKGVKKQHDISNPKTWLLAIARNSAIDYLRKQKQNVRKVERLKDNKLFSYDSLADIYHLSERKKELLQNIYRLKTNYREVIIMRGIEGYSVSETANILNWSENKVNVTYHRALKELKSALLQEEGVFYGE
jgi:RNA polymerase sigma-70 factor, ECF subfamily